jgi:hypothetical protein
MKYAAEMGSRATIYILSRDTVWLQTGFELMIGFTGLFDTARDYNSLLHTHWYPQSRCSVAASNGGRPPSGFPKYPRSQLPATLD